MDMPTLTPRQKEVYDYIRSYIENNHDAPYLREIQEACRVSSHKAVIDILLALERKDYIKREMNKHRSIKLKGAKLKPQSNATIKMERQKPINPFIEIYNDLRYREPTKNGMPDFPLLVDIEITNICNLTCLMCSRQIMKRELGFMDMGLFSKIVKQTKDKTRGLRFMRWGEPMLHPQVLEMVRLAKENGLSVHITTNGLWPNSIRPQEIISSGLDSIIFSFQGTTKEEYQHIRNNQRYDELVKNVLSLLEERKRVNTSSPFVQITTTILDEDLKQVIKFVKEWEKVVEKVDWWYTSLMRLCSLDTSKELLQRQIIRKKRDFIHSPCYEVQRKFAIDWNGDVTACCGDFNAQLFLGNIRDYSLQELWLGEKMSNYRRLLNKGDRQSISFCRDCTSKF